MLLAEFFSFDVLSGPQAGVKDGFRTNRSVIKVRYLPESVDFYL